MCKTVITVHSNPVVFYSSQFFHTQSRACVCSESCIHYADGKPLHSMTNRQNHNPFLVPFWQNLECCCKGAKNFGHLQALKHCKLKCRKEQINSLLFMWEQGIQQIAVVRSLQSPQPRNHSIPSQSKKFFSSPKCPDWHRGLHSIVVKGYWGQHS